MNVKVCGIRRYEDARVALDEGAWALGFIFHAPSPRYLDPEAAWNIVRKLPREAVTVGVFVDWPLEELREAVRASGVRGVQLHGREDLAYAKATGCDLVIKAFRTSPDFEPRSALEYPGCKILIDAYDPQAAGGTGKRADWALARRAAELVPIILAGAIGPENAAEAALAVRPEGLDVSSGVESAPGVKDPEKIRSLFRALRDLKL